MTVRLKRVGLALAGLSVASLALAGCGTGRSHESSDGALRVVASTNVWGSVAQAVGGDAVHVDSIIRDAGTDPHSYEGTPRDAAKLHDADLVVYNGGGYDEFAAKMAESGRDQHTVRAVDAEQDPSAQPRSVPGGAAKHEHASLEHGNHEHSDVNEHVWYDVDAVRAVADRIADQLGQLRPQQAQQFTDNAARFEQGLDGLRQHEQTIASSAHGKPVIVTEPVAHYLVRDTGLHDITPPQFVKSVEEEQDPPATAIAQIQQVLTSHDQPATVLFNPQTASALTKQVKRWAEQQSIPMTNVTETMPAGQDYLHWMGGQLDHLEHSLGHS